MPPAKKAAKKRAPAKKKPAAKRPRKKSASIAERARKDPSWGGSSSYARALRDAVIWELHCQGVPAVEIAKDVDLGPGQVREVIKKWRDEAAGSTSVLDLGAIEIVEGVLRRGVMRSRFLMKIAIDAENPSAVVGALKAWREEDVSMVEILQALGKLPKNLGTLRHVIDIQAISAKMLDALDAFDRGEITAKEVREIFEETISIGAAARRPQLGPGS